MNAVEFSAVHALVQAAIGEVMRQAGMTTCNVSRAKMEELHQSHTIETAYDLSSGWTVTLTARAPETENGGPKREDE
ncbi:hypothetical protein Nazgul14 [Burkholderia phage BcepNazgul]|uniref:Uncharacterized protein n=1 Tax=Burkholderia phage BcepNazgul TaxID=242861 RepID=Q6UYF1_9CAUD|nr:hypothetical protein Nazgul14 [Burkholderia phage BcepNazgul]AAQ63390.1 hypothetical protein Nazgul14 [Burkholderia phage BcepNazgul]